MHEGGVVFFVEWLVFIDLFLFLFISYFILFDFILFYFILFYFVSFIYLCMYLFIYLFIYFSVHYLVIFTFRFLRFVFDTGLWMHGYFLGLRH